MKWLRRLFRHRRDPTRDWDPDPSLELSLELDPPTLCGVPLGEPLERLRALGPCDSSGLAAGGLLIYSARCLWIHVHEGCVWELSVSFGDPRHDEPAYSGGLTWRGRPCRWSAQSTLAEVKADLGEPYVEVVAQEAGGDSHLFYALRTRMGWVELCFTHCEGYLEDLVLCFDATLADADARRALGVELPWPPRS